MKIKKFAVVGVALLAFVVNASPVLSAQAHTVEPAIPTYGLYCNNPSTMLWQLTVRWSLLYRLCRQQ